MRNIVNSILFLILSFVFILLVFWAKNRVFIVERHTDVSRDIVLLSKGRTTITNHNIRGSRLYDKLAVSALPWKSRPRQSFESTAAVHVLSLVTDWFAPAHIFNAFFFHGVTFARTITQTAPGVNVTLTFHQGYQHCQKRDVYGDDDCKYHWGENMGGLLSGSLPYDLVEGDLVIGDFRIDEMTPLTFTCNVCGRPCTISIPVINQEIEVDTPKCPIEKDQFHHAIGEILPEKVFLPETIIQGTIKAVRADGATVVLSADADIKVHW